MANSNTYLIGMERSAVKMQNEERKMERAKGIEPSFPFHKMDMLKL
jgi:hypothetical protein